MMYAALLLPAFAAVFAFASPLAKPIVARQSNGTYPVYPDPPVSTQYNGSSTDPSSATGRENPTYTQDELNAIKLSYSAASRYSYIQSLGDTDLYFKFDYSTQANPNPVAGLGQGGQGDLSYVENWPALLGTGVSMSMGFMEPCGMNTPHTHNRATELLTIVQGKNVKTSFVQESGLTNPITTTLNLYQGAILPMGSIHYEFNDNCEPAVFVAAFSNEDPGLSRTAQNFFGEDPNIVRADLGWPKFLDATNIAAFKATIPKPFALGAEECLKRCGITYNATEH